MYVNSVKTMILSYVVYIDTYIFGYVHLYMSIGTIIQGPSNVTYFPGDPNITLICTTSVGVPVWIVNGTVYTLSQLDNPNSLPGHSRTGSNIVIEAPPANNTRYVCEVAPSLTESFMSDPAFVYVAGEYIQ